MNINARKAGLLFGFFYVGWHASWLVLVVAGLAKPLLDWVLGLHFLSLEFAIQPFDLGRAAMLLVIAFLSGYAIGWILATGWNMLKE